jgi:hypothetical protein
MQEIIPIPKANMSMKISLGSFGRYSDNDTSMRNISIK